MTREATDLRPVAEHFASLREACGALLIGHDEALRQVYITLLCGGHSLLEGVPGVGKTLLVRSLAGALGIRFGRLQFTPDLMPSDVIGTTLLEGGSGEPRFRPGPLFTDLLLADEINRASAKTQAALLEAMQEGTATVDGVRHLLGEHFCVFATQNPVEHEGTYPLPEAELDRFLFKITMGYPAEEEEREILRRHHAGEPGAVPPVIEGAALAALRAAVRGVIAEDAIIAYVTHLVRATRDDLQIALGASPRSALLLLRAAKAQAAIEGRDFTLPEDVQQVWLPTMRHRVIVEASAEMEGVSADSALERTLQGVAVPR